MISVIGDGNAIMEMPKSSLYICSRSYELGIRHWLLASL